MKEKILSILIILIILFGVVGCGNSKVDVDDETAAKWFNCSQKTNSYYKCSWSNHEERCVCKAR